MVISEGAIAAFKPVFAVFILLGITSVMAAPLKSSPSRSNDLSAVLADMDEGNREGSKTVSVTSGMKSEGIELIIHRLTLGRRIFHQENGIQVDDADPSYSQRAIEAASANIRFGAYHVLFPSHSGEDDGAKQAYDFLTAVKDRCVPGQNLILAVDWERAKCLKRSCGIPEPKYIASFIPAVTKVTGKPVLVYTAPDILAKYSDEIKVGTPVGNLVRENPLWLASYYSKFAFSREAGNVRMGFVFPQSDQLLPWDRWTFWQFAASEDGDTPLPSRSVSLTIQNHRIDLSWFAGSREEFFRFYDDHAIACDAIDLSKF